jgi:membrane protease YdiL (CAAX protease family)
MFAMLSGFSVYVRLGSTTPRIGHLLIYPIIIAFEWALFALCLWNTDSAFVGYLARVVRDPRSLRVDIPVALLIGGICFVVAPVMVRVLGNTGWVSVEGMHPDNGWEIALWMVMAISAGICEEAVFRGYFQQQFSGWSGHASVGVLGQAAVFGVGHAYQGWKNVTLIFVIGCILGVFAVLRKGLRANMIAHVIMDALAAF